MQLARFVNISSQSVYGSNYKPFANEDSTCNPDYLYAMAKYSSELICEQGFSSSNVQLINIRLSSVCENARFIRVFAQNIIELKPIILTSPHQIVSFIDVRDVASALVSVIKSHDVQGTYNLGSGEIYTILDVAKETCNIATNILDIHCKDIIIEDHGNCSSVGMDITKFSNTFKWRPVYTLDNMIESIFAMLCIKPTYISNKYLKIMGGGECQ